MNVATLEAALPALTVSLLTGVDDNAQVSTSDRPPIARRTDVHVIWQFVEDVALADAGGLGRPMHGLRYTASVYGASASQATRRLWGEELREGLHYQRKPAITGLDHAQVLAFAVNPEAPGVGAVGVPGGTGPAQGEADVLFVGDVEV